MSATATQQKYNVHLYAVVRVKVVDVEASSQEEAIAKAEDSVLLGRILNHERGLPDNVECTEYAEEVVRYLVDEEGDEEYDKSKWYVWKGDDEYACCASEAEEARAILERYGQLKLERTTE